MLVDDEPATMIKFKTHSIKPLRPLWGRILRKSGGNGDFLSPLVFSS